MYDLIELKACIDDASRAGWDENDHSHKGRKETYVPPGQFFEPPKQTCCALSPACKLKGGKHRERGKKGRDNDDHRQDDLEKFPERRYSRLHQLMVESDRYRV